MTSERVASLNEFASKKHPGLVGVEILTCEAKLVTGRLAVTEQVVAGTGAGDVQKLTLGIVDFFEVGTVTKGVDSALGRDDLIIAGDDGDCAEFQALGAVHGCEGDMVAIGRQVGSVRVCAPTPRREKPEVSFPCTP